jgi:MATE family multidrug resistance protein
MVVSSSSTPLLGLVDTAIIGNLGSAAYLGAIALGTLVFNFLYWAFGFLRMGTTGFTAQSFGARDESEIQTNLWRPISLAIFFGVLLILFQWPLELLAFRLIGAGDDVTALAKEYFAIRIWAAPATLMSYVLVGWFIGLQKTRLALLLQLWLNGANILLDIIFVMGFKWGVSGVAAGSLIAEITTAFLGIWLVLKRNRKNQSSTKLPSLTRLLDPRKISKFVSVNFDIFVRTLCLLFAFGWFTSQSAKMGTTILAANHILLQFTSFSACFLDGFAFATETLVGSAIGAKSRSQLMNVTTRSLKLAGLTALLLSGIIALSGSSLIDLLTNVAAVKEAAREFLPLVSVIPILSVWCFLLDGIYIGATHTRDMRNMMLLSLLFYLAAWFLFTTWFGAHGLWIALGVFFIVRGITLALRFPTLLKTTIPA